MKTTLPNVKLFPGGVDVKPERGSIIGKRWPAEWSQYADPLTGKTVTKYTSSSGTDQHPYFTGPAVTTDGRRLVFISDRTGNPNLFSLDMTTGQILQLTDNRYGTLRQYVFSWGNLGGFGKSSVVLNPNTGNVFYLQGRQVRRVNAYSGEQKTIAELPPGWVTSFTHVSADDKWLCVPLIPEAAFLGSEEVTINTHYPQGFGWIGDRARKLNLFSELWVVATDGSEQSVWARQRSWVTHVQFCPTDSRYILFNNEAAGEHAGSQRMWMCDGQTGELWKIRPEPLDRKHWTSHENWSRDGKAILYHGASQVEGIEQLQPYFGVVDRSGKDYTETYLRRGEWQGTGHFTEHPTSGHLITDGYIGEMKLIAELWPAADGHADWRPICRHDSQWIYQDDHPHPIWSPGCGQIIFSSSRASLGDVYGVIL
jgi:hypothetical protein